MKIQYLAVVFIIIMLPISLVLAEYTKGQIKTLELQISYDSKLDTATHDAIKAYQLNSANSDTSDIADSKIRDIEASINTFFNSIATNFNMVGYNQEILNRYVPALVYTMYDGMYIYTSYNNTLDKSISNNLSSGAEYQNGEQMEGLKPYIYYSCRYKKSNIDVVITYAMDNYIQVDGKIGNTTVHRYGYLYNPSDITVRSDENIEYNLTSSTKINIQPEAQGVQENLLESDGTHRKYKYLKLNGVKYYYDETNRTWFSLINGQKMPQQDFNSAYLSSNDFACRYFKEAKGFSEWFFSSGLADLTPSDAVDENGNSIVQNLENNNEYGVTTSVKNNFSSNQKIFNQDNIEDADSSFNDHRLAVIRYTIEKNLSIAIANYNTFTGGASAGFQMPSLTEEEWAGLLNNMSMISFLQGLSIGGKVYNGYSVVTNNKNKEVVTEESIYIVGNDNNYHMVTDKDIKDNVGTVRPIIGYLNTDFERNTIDDQNGSKYFFARPELACYGSIVSHINLETSITSIKEYLSKNLELAKVYYTALARERYSAFKANREYDTYLNQFIE